MKATRTLLVDGDIVAYKAATIAETPIDWGDGVWTLHAHGRVVSIHHHPNQLVSRQSLLPCMQQCHHLPIMF